MSILQLIADLIAYELTRKLGIDASIGFRRLRAADIQARARAFGGMVAAGINEPAAFELSGLEA